MDLQHAALISYISGPFTILLPPGQPVLSQKFSNQLTLLHQKRYVYVKMAGPGPSQAPTTSVVVIVEYDQSSRPTATRTVTEVIQDGTTSTLSAPNTSTGTSSSSQNTSSVLSISSGNTTAQPVSTLTTTATRPLNCPGTYLSIASLCEYDTSGTPIGLRESTTTFLSGSGTTSLPVVLVTYVPIQAVSNSSATSPSTADSTASSQTGMSSPSHTTAPSHKNSTGAIAGAAVGGIVAGALIAGLIGFFLLKKRARKDRYVSRNTYVPAASPAYGGEKGTPMVSIASAATMDFLPQQADDAEVSRKISTVVDQIDQHVENFYANRGAPMDANREAEISRFETSELPLPLAACFQNSGAPMTLIKHCLAYHIFNLTMSPSEHAMPLLPAEIAGVVTSMYHKSLSPVASKGKFERTSTCSQLTRGQTLLPHSAPGSHSQGICAQTLVGMRPQQGPYRKVRLTLLRTSQTFSRLGRTHNTATTYARVI